MMTDTPTFVTYKEPFTSKIRRKIREISSSVITEVIDWLLRHHPDVKGSNIVSYADSELKAAGWANKDGFYGDMVYHAAMRQARLFSIEGHSGMSAGLVNSICKSLNSYEPLSPLTGEDDEWNEVGTEIYQNKRASSVFKNGKNGKAYRIDGKVFVEPSGAAYTSSDSRVFIKFPYTWRKPKTVRVAEAA